MILFALMNKSYLLLNENSITIQYTMIHKSSIFTYLFFLSLCFPFGIGTLKAQDPIETPRLGPDVGLIINEFRVAADSGQTALEYLELLVVACPGRGEYTGNIPDNIGPDTTFVDLRGWIIDDNNGDFSGNATTPAPTHPSVSNGFIRFTNDPSWARVPVGAIIVIYHSDSLAYGDNFILSDDPEDIIVPDRLYVLGIDQVDYLEVGFGPYGAPTSTQPVDTLGTSWQHLELRGQGDALQSRFADGTFFHGLSYGDLTGLPLAPPRAPANQATRGVSKAGINGSNRIFVFSNPIMGGFYDNYRDDIAYIDTSVETPGDQNNALNGRYLFGLTDAADAGPDTTFCSLRGELDARGADARWAPETMWTLSSDGMWTVEATPTGVDPGSVVFFDVDDGNSGVAVAEPGEYTFRWTVQPGNESGCRDSDIVNVLFIENPRATVERTGPFCLSEGPGFLRATGFLLGGEWTYIPRDSTDTRTVVLSSSTDPEPEVTVSEQGRYTFRWRVGASGCEDFRDVDVVFIQDFMTEAGPDTTSCGRIATLNGNDVPGEWEQIAGPGTAVFTAPPGADTEARTPSSFPNARVTVPAFATEVSYTFRWRVGAPGSSCERFDDVTITFLPEPVAQAGNDTTICDFNYQFAGNALTGSQTGNWRLASSDPPTDGTNNPDFINRNQPDATVNVQFEGQYTFEWRIDAANACFDTDLVNVYFVEIPSANAGPDEDTLICGLTGSFIADLPTLPVNRGSIRGQWNVLSTPVGIDSANVMIADDTLNTSAVTVPAPGRYEFAWTVTRTVNGVNCDSTDVVAYVFEVPPTADILPVTLDSLEACGDTLTLSAETSGTIGFWSTIEQPVDAPDPVFSDSTQTTTSIITFQEGRYRFGWTGGNIINGDTCAITDTILVDFVAFPEPDAGADTIACTANLLYNLSANGLAGTWRVLESPPTATNPAFSDLNAPNAVFATDAEGTYLLEWELNTGSSAQCVVQDTLELTLLIPPVPEAGVDRANICGQRDTLVGNLPNGTVGAWTQMSGPGNSIFTSVNDSTVIVEVDQVGDYTYAWTLERMFDGMLVCPVSDMVNVGFIDFPIPEAGDSLPDICFPDNPTVQLQATASQGPTGVGVWSVLSSPAGRTIDFVDMTDPQTSVTVDGIGEYILVWTIEPGNTCESSDTTLLRFTDFLQAEVVPLPDTICGLTTQLESIDQFPFGQWTADPATGVVFEDATSPNTMVTVPERGRYVFTWTIGNGNCRSTSATNNALFVNPLENVPENFTLNVFLGNSIELNVDTGVEGATYTWAPDPTLSALDIPNPTASPLESRVYTVNITTGTDEAACNATVQVGVNVVFDLEVPNVFTPNGDGINEAWEIPLLGTLEGVEVKVFDRWGGQVFESVGYDIPWGGKYNSNDVGSSTFYYVIKFLRDVVDDNGQLRQVEDTKTGYVVVTR